MKIVIAGAGEVGFHLAQLLANENQDITLIDKDKEVLEYATTHLDVLTIKGDAASFQVLEQAQAGKARLFLALTTSEKTNLLTAILAKKMGAKKTVARVNNAEYLQAGIKENFNQLGVDVLISPDQLGAQEIVRLLKRSTFTDVFDFEEGKISVIGFTLDGASPLVGKTLRQADRDTPDFLFKAIAIQRGNKTIIPNGDSLLMKGDHLYLVTKNEYIDVVTKYAGKQLKKIRNVMIIGGSPLAQKTAQLLENDYAVSLVEKDKEEGKLLLESLHNTLIINANPGNIDVLKEEGLESMDAFIALTPNAETNIITSLMAEEWGVPKTIALVDNAVYTHISKNIGVDTIINIKLIAANNIFRFVRKGKIEAITSFHGVDAEIIEFVIHKNNRLTRHPLRELHLPEKAIIAGVIRGTHSYIPKGDFQLKLNDKVIVFAHLEAISKIESTFR